MKVIKFNDKQYNIPTQWSEINVGMLIKSAELSEILEDAPIIAIINAYTGIPVKELKLSLSKEVEEVIAIMTFISEPYIPTPQTSFTLSGIRYSCEEELVNQKFEDFVSIQTALYNNREEPYRALPRLLAILCKREGETLDDFNITERSTIMESCPMTDAKNIEAFFLTSLEAYRGIMLLSSTQKEQEELVLHKVKELQNTMKAYKGRSGGSFGTKLRIGIYQLQLWWVKRVLEKYYNSQPTNNLKKNWKQTCKKLVMKMLKRKSND